MYILVTCFAQNTSVNHAVIPKHLRVEKRHVAAGAPT